MGFHYILNPPCIENSKRVFVIQSILFTTTMFVPNEFDIIKLNFCCNELKFKLNWCICANTMTLKRILML